MKKHVLQTVLAGAVMWAAACSDDKTPEPPVADFRLTASSDIAEFSHGETRTITFYAEGEGARNLTLKLTDPEGWKSRPLSFAENDGNGYDGEISVTAPDRDSRGRLVVTVANAAGLSRSLEIELVSTETPLRVELSVSTEKLEMIAGERAGVPFTVTRSVAAELMADVKAPEGWKAEIDGFGADDPSDASAPYKGTLLVTAPGTPSSGEIVLSILNLDKNVLASAKIAVECSADVSIKITPETSVLTLGFGEERTFGFTVTGTGATGITADAEITDGWKAEVESLEETAGGYEGRIKITSPAQESSGALTISARNADGETAEAEVSVSCVSYAVHFTQSSYDFGLLETKAVIYTVTGTSEELTSRITVPKGWTISDRTFGAGSDGYTGSFMLKSTGYPETNVLWVEITDSEGHSSRTPVEIKCDGGTKIPESKRGANCILVTSAGTVSFDAVTGDGTPVNGSSVKWIWYDEEGVIDPASLKYSAGRITLSTGTPFTPGNALVALLDQSGKIKWSWHIWVTDAVNVSAPSGEFMNMNLGATSADRTSVCEDFGLFYQWGRKEPFPSPKDKNGDTEDESSAFVSCTRPVNLNQGYSWGYTDKQMPTHEEAAGYPTTMTLLGSQLPSAVYEAWPPQSDPCPKGWRVPTHSELTKHWGIYDDVVTNVNSDSAHGYGTAPPDRPSEWWPAAGCRMTSAGLRNWMGALRLTGGGNYWTSTPFGIKGEYDPEADYQDIGYVSAAKVGWSQHYYISLSAAWPKNYACSIRCIKE